MKINILLILVIGVLVSSCSDVDTPTGDVINVPEAVPEEVNVIEEELPGVDVVEVPVVEETPEPVVEEVPEPVVEEPEPVIEKTPIEEADEAKAIEALGGDVVVVPEESTEEETPVAGEATINIIDGVFEPEELTVSIGTKVTWFNDDVRPHKVVDTLPDREFYGERIKPGESYSHTFTKAGEFNYFDVVFYSMRGKVIVE